MSILSEDKFEDFIKELPQMKALYNEKDMLLASNKSLAEYNLSQVGWYHSLWDFRTFEYNNRNLFWENVKLVWLRNMLQLEN